jgi:hypothetical protein
MLLFWKMCNRALDLLDSLFEISSFRPGLWIYGHCVEYKCCNHALDPKGAGFDFLVASSGSLLQMWCGDCNGLACWMNCIRSVVIESTAHRVAIFFAFSLNTLNT